MLIVVATLALTAVLAQPAPVEDPQLMWTGHLDTAEVRIPATWRVYTGPPLWPSSWTAMGLELPGCKQSCTDDSDCSSSPPCFGLCDNLGPGWSGTCT